MLEVDKDILQLHEELRIAINKNEIEQWIETGQIESHLFLSMCSTIHNNIHRDALFDLCKKFKFVRPVARKSLKGFMAQYNEVKAGATIPACRITERDWNSETKATILSLRNIDYEPSDTILKCVQDMIRHDLHMKAMFEICEKYGALARTLVSFVLNRYKYACANNNQTEQTAEHVFNCNSDPEIKKFQNEWDIHS